MLFNEPKLLKCSRRCRGKLPPGGFSALQRAEIAEIIRHLTARASSPSFSALQRAEIAEIMIRPVSAILRKNGFSALQRAEIAEIVVE